MNSPTIRFYPRGGMGAVAALSRVAYRTCELSYSCIVFIDDRTVNDESHALFILYTMSKSPCRSAVQRPESPGRRVTYRLSDADADARSSAARAR